MSTGIAAIIGAVACAAAISAGAATLTATTHAASPSSATSLDSAILTLHPDGYWPMTDPAGSTSAADETERNADLIDYGAGNQPRFGAPGPDGATSVKFTKSQQFLLGPTMPAEGTILFVTNLGTYRPNDFCLLEPRNGTWQNFARFQVNATTGHATFGDTNGAFVQGQTNVEDGHWHLIAVTFTGGTATLYVDGQAEGTTSVSFDSGYPSSAGFYVGNSTGARIGHVAFASQAATPAELQTIADTLTSN